MLKIVEEANASQISFVRRAVTFAASLALKQQHPEVALHILLGTKQQGYVTVRNLKLLAFSRLGRFENALSLLRSCVDTDPPESGRKRSFTIDTVSLPVWRRSRTLKRIYPFVDRTASWGHSRMWRW